MAKLAEEHLKFSAEQKQLLTAQVLLTDRVSTIAGKRFNLSRNFRNK
jgi:hypothetical protein